MSSKRYMIRAAVYLMLVKDNKVLLMKRYSTGWMDGMYTFPAGHIEKGEPVSQSVIREAYEEIRINIKQKDLQPVTVMHRKSPDQEYIDFYYAVKKWKGEPTIGEPDKCDNVSWFPIDQLPKNSLPYLQEVIKNYKAKIAFSESGW